MIVESVADIYLVPISAMVGGKKHPLERGAFYEFLVDSGKEDLKTIPHGSCYIRFAKSGNRPNMSISSIDFSFAIS